jgi:hypothetical protein
VLLGTDARHVVVHHSCREELEHFAYFFDLRIVRTRSDLPFDLVVLFDDLLVSQGEVIFTTARIGHGDRWSDGRRRHSQVVDDHVRWVGIALVQAHHL